MMRPSRRLLALGACAFAGLVLASGCAARDERRAAQRLAVDRAARATFDRIDNGGRRAASLTWTAAGLSRDGEIAWWAGAFDPGADAPPDAAGHHVTMVLHHEDSGWVPLGWAQAVAPPRALGAPMPDPERPQAAAADGDSLSGERAARIARQLRKDLGRIGRVLPSREAIVVGPFAGMHRFGRKPGREQLRDLARDWSSLQIHPDQVRVVRVPGTRSAWVRADILGIYAGSGPAREVPLRLFAVYQQADENWRLAMLHLARDVAPEPVELRAAPAPRRRARGT